MNSSILEAHKNFISTHRNRPFYAIYPTVAILILCSVVGIFGHLNIVWASIRKRELRSNCNILIAVGAFSEIFHQTAHFSLAYYIYSAKNFISLRQCYYLQFMPIIGMNYGGFIVLSVGVDRFLSVWKATAYQRLFGIRRFAYMCIQMTIPAIFSSYLASVAYQSMLAYSESDVICVIAEAFHAHSKDVWSFSMFCLNSLIIVCYIGIWIFIKVTKPGVYDKRIIRSLFVIMIMVMCGWLITSIGMSLGIALGASEEQMLLLHMNVGWTINLSIAGDYFVLLCLNRDYRLAFYEQLRILSGGRLIPDPKKAMFITSVVTGELNAARSAGSIAH